MKTYFIYARKSSEQDERQALSIESQKAEIAKKFPDIKVVEILQESKSAFIPDNRPKFADMILRIKRGEVDGIVSGHPDRLSRNEMDAAQITYLVRTGVIKDLLFGSYYFDNSPEGIMMLQSALSHSQYSSAKLSKDVKRGLKTKAEKGWLPSGAKAGYMNDKYAEKGSKTILEDPERFPLIRKAWDLMLTGIYSPIQVLRTLNEDWGYRTPKHRRIGGKPMSRSHIYKLFTDPFYYGEFEYQGNLYTGKHKPMISREEFDQVQVFLGNKGRPRPKTHDFTYTGLVRCGECEATITAEEKFQIICSHCKYKFASLNKVACPKCKTLISAMDNPTRLHYTYYHCTKRKKKTCKQKAIRVENFEKQFDSLLEGIQISEDFKGWAIKHLNEVADIETEDRNAILKSQQTAYDDCVKRIDNLLKFKISPQNSNGELLSDEEFKIQKDALLKEKSKLLEGLQSTDNRIDQWLELTEKTFEFACYARHWFAHGDKDTKKQILLGIGSNLTLKDGIVGVDLQKPLKFIEFARKEVREISPMFEPEKEGYKSGQMKSFYSKNSILLALTDYVGNYYRQFLMAENVQIAFSN